MAGINAGVPSDRLLAEWQLDAPAVVQRAAGRTVAVRNGLRVAIPANFEALLANDLQTAISERLRVREELNAAFAEGFRITEFDTESCEYLLSKP